MSDRIRAFEPFFGQDARLLILGSFPSVKSRKVEFYYGNRQNRFWRVIASFFGEAVPETVEEKKSLLLRRKIALWDVVTECNIRGSEDASIRNFETADVPALCASLPIELVLLNGKTAANIYFSRCAAPVPALPLPSTSPANTRFDESVWKDALARVFGAAGASGKSE